jgi:hypothetical protein
MYAKPQYRTISVTAILDDAFTIIRKHFALLFGIAAIIIVPFTLLSSFLTRNVSADYSKHASRLADLADQTRRGFSVSNTTMTNAFEAVARDGAKLLAIAGSFSIVQYGLMGGALAVAVSESYAQRQTSLAHSYNVAIHRLVPLLASMITLFALLLVIGAVPAGVAAVAGAPGLGVVLLMVSLIAVVILGIRLSLVMQAVVLEKHGLASLKRSFRLTRGYFWKTLGVLVLTTIMVSLMVNLIDSIVLHFTGDNAAISTVINLVISTATTPLVLCAQTLLFLNLKVVKEEYTTEMLVRDLAALP